MANADLRRTGQRILDVFNLNRKVIFPPSFATSGFSSQSTMLTTDDPTVNKALLEFPYYSNYVDLTRMELYALFSMSSTELRSFAFIGSGPLPLTSLCIADILDNEINNSEAQIRIHNIDRDQQAISLSSSLCQKLGRRARSMTFQCTEAVEEGSTQDLKAFDVVYLAALVGSTKAQKGEIISDIASRMRPGALLVLRSAHSLRSLLYPVLFLSPPIPDH